MNDAPEILKLAVALEALLFALGEPLEHGEAAKLLGVSAEKLAEAAALIREGGRGIVLVDDGKTFELRAAPEAAALIERVRKETYNRDIGKAGLETLAAVLYKGPLSRSQVDFIRGVNSSQILRTLTMRGLLRKIENPRDERSFLYEPTTELLSQLGVSALSELPEYAAIQEKLHKLQEARAAEPETPLAPQQ